MIEQTRNNKRSILTLNIMSSYLNKLISWLVNVLKINKHLLTIMLKHKEKIFRIARTRGIKEAISFNKEYRLKFLKFLFNDLSFEGISFKVPSDFKVIRDEYRHKGKNVLRAFISVLYITRTFKLETNPSYSTIEMAPQYRGDPRDLRSEMMKFLKSIGMNERHFFRKPKKLDFTDYHHSSKRGPNGLALWSSLEDFKALPFSLIQDIGQMGGQLLKDNLDMLFWIGESKLVNDFFNTSKRNCFRKISLIADKEGKTREVAIGDYFSQTVLRPLHIYTASILKRLKGDCMFEQGKLITKVKAHHGHSYHSIDLSSATDRFPIGIQKELLTILAGVEYAECWKRVMVGHEFESSKGNLKYNTGNPMGFYSSFTMFSLAHHFFVWMSCQKANVNFNKLPYMLLGDDIVIGNDNVAKEYKLLLKLWDIPYNEEKTHVSKVGYEFAKQICFHDQNISPLSLSSFYNNRSDTRVCISFLVEELKNKEWDIDSGIWIESYLRSIQMYSSKRYKKMKPFITLSLTILDYLQGRCITLGPQLVEYVKQYYTSPVLSNIAVTTLLGNEILRNMIIEEQENKLKDSINLFDGKTDNTRVLHLMSLIREDPILSEATQYCYRSIPLLSYYNNDVIIPLVTAIKMGIYKPKSAKEKYDRKLLNKIYKVDVRPTNLRDFYARNRKVQYRTSWNIAKQFMLHAQKIQHIEVFGKPLPLKLVPIKKSD